MSLIWIVSIKKLNLQKTEYEHKDTGIFLLERTEKKTEYKVDNDQFNSIVAVELVRANKVFFYILESYSFDF